MEDERTTISPITVPLAFGAPLVEATFVARPVQLVVLAQLGDEIVRAHMADRGRLRELLVPGRRLVLARRNEAGRKTAFQVVAAYGEEGLVSLDTHLPNRLIGAALAARAVAPFAHYETVRREATFSDSRFDFLLSAGDQRCVVEVKSVGKVAAGVATFPDAPTSRGVRHLHGLMRLVHEGLRAAVVFVVQGSGVQSVAPDAATDPLFAATLHAAATAGVEIYAYACPFRLEGISFGPAVPVVTPGDM